MRELEYSATLELRAEGQGGDGRTVDLRIVPFGTIARTANGLESIERGAFEGTDPADVVLRQDHLDPPAGRGIELEERDDAAYMSFRVARTPRGDELLANLAEGMHRSASIGFEEIPGGSTVRAFKGEPVRVHRKLRLREVGTTWRPVYPEAAVLAVRAEGNNVDTPETAAATAPAPIMQTVEPGLDALRGRIAELEERSRSAIALPPGLAAPQLDEAIARGQWAALALRSLAGERVDPSELAAVLPALHTRAAVDVISSDNLGVVPPQFRPEVIGIINKSRPFLESTREVPAGTSGLTFNFPKITQRPLTGVQATEKADVASRKTIIGTVPFDPISIAGVGDLSIQLLRRSSPQFLTLWLDLLAESYAINADDYAVDALLASAVNAGGALDPAAPTFGTAFTNAAAVAPGSTALLPDRIWLSTAAVAAFIDAKSPTGGGGLPLYPGLASIQGLTNGQGGPLPISMKPVWTPALDDEAGAAIVVGPSAGFAWAEDGTYQLTADVPEKAGRDVGLVGMLWLMPIYPGAFTTYTLPVVIP
jgi:HK97 family phage prohead protease